MIVACPACNKRYDVSGRPSGMEAKCRCGQRFRIPEPSANAATKSCTSCGAAVRANAASCTYCGSPVAQTRCPRCFGLVAADGRHCQHCGISIESGATAATVMESRDIHCPRCETAKLEALLVDGVALDHCTKCGGVWLDHTVFGRLQSNEAANAPVMLRIADLPKPRPQAATKAYIPCPECRSLMIPRNFAGCSGVIVDECRAHGVWFDPGELSTIMQFIRDGGLDRARRRDLQRAEEQTRQKRFGAALDGIRDARVSGAAAATTDPGKDWPLEAAAQFLSNLFG